MINVTFGISIHLGKVLDGTSIEIKKENNNENGDENYEDIHSG